MGHDRYYSNQTTNNNHVSHRNSNVSITLQAVSETQNTGAIDGRHHHALHEIQLGSIWRQRDEKNIFKVAKASDENRDEA